MAEPAAEIAVAADGDVAVVTVTGMIDISNAEQLQVAITAAAADTVIDLSACDFMDSSGLGALLAAQRLLDKDGRRTAIVCVPSGSLSRTLSVTGLQDLFPVHDDRAGALAALRQG